MVPVIHCLSVKPPLTFASASAYDFARFLRAGADETNCLTTFHAAAGKRMFFSAFSSALIGGPVGLAFSVVPLLFPTLVTRIAMAPATRTRAPRTSSQRLKRRDDSALWTTFTAIRIVDAGTAVRLEPKDGSFWGGFR